MSALDESSWNLNIDDLLLVADGDENETLVEPAQGVELRHPDYDPADELDEGVVSKAVHEIKALGKADFDKKHPRWPKGAPHGKGGKFVQVGERFVHNGKNYEVTAIHGGRITAQIADGGSTPDELSIKAKEVAGVATFEATPSKPHKIHGQVSFSKEAKGQLVIDPHVDSSTHDPSIPAPDGFTAEEWARFGKEDQEHFVHVQERFGKWEAGKSKQIINHLKSQYSTKAISAIEQALSHQYGSGADKYAGKTLSLAGIFASGTIAEQYPVYEEAKLALRDMADAIHWNLYHSVRAPDMTLTHRGHTTPEQLKKTYFEDDIPILGAYAWSTGLTQTDQFGPIATVAPIAIRHLDMHTGSGGAYLSFQGEDNEQELAIGSRIKLDPDKVIIQQESGLPTVVRKFLQSSTHAKSGKGYGKLTSGAVVLEAIKALNDPSYELPLPPQAHELSLKGGQGKPSYDPIDAKTSAAIKDMVAGLGYDGGTPEAAQGTLSELVGKGLTAGDFIEGMKGTRYVVVKDAGDSSAGLRYVKVGKGTDASLAVEPNFDKSYAFSASFNEPFRKLDGHIDIPKPAAKEGEFVPMSQASMDSMMPAGEATMVQNMEPESLIKVDGTVYKVLTTSSTDATLLSMENGKEYKINPLYKTEKLGTAGYVHVPEVEGDHVIAQLDGVPTVVEFVGHEKDGDDYTGNFWVVPLGSDEPVLTGSISSIPPAFYAPKGVEVGDVFVKDGKQYTVTSMLKNGTVRARFKGGKVEKFDPDQIKLDTEISRFHLRPSDWAVGDKTKARDLAPGELISGSNVKVRPYRVVSVSKDKKTVTLLNMETGEVTTTTGGKSWPRLVTKVTASSANDDIEQPPSVPTSEPSEPQTTVPHLEVGDMVTLALGETDRIAALTNLPLGASLLDSKGLVWVKKADPMSSDKVDGIWASDAAVPGGDKWTSELLGKNLALAPYEVVSLPSAPKPVDLSKETPSDAKTMLMHAPVGAQIVIPASSGDLTGDLIWTKVSTDGNGSWSSSKSGEAVMGSDSSLAAYAATGDKEAVLHPLGVDNSFTDTPIKIVSKTVYLSSLDHDTVTNMVDNAPVGAKIKIVMGSVLDEQKTIESVWTKTDDSHWVSGSGMQGTSASLVVTATQMDATVTLESVMPPSVSNDATLAPEFYEGNETPMAFENAPVGTMLRIASHSPESDLKDGLKDGSLVMVKAKDGGWTFMAPGDPIPEQGSSSSSGMSSMTSQHAIKWEKLPEQADDAHATAQAVESDGGIALSKLNYDSIVTKLYAAEDGSILETASGAWRKQGNSWVSAWGGNDHAFSAMGLTDALFAEDSTISTPTLYGSDHIPAPPPVPYKFDTTTFAYLPTGTVLEYKEGMPEVDGTPLPGYSNRFLVKTGHSTWTTDTGEEVGHAGAYALATSGPEPADIKMPAHAKDITEDTLLGLPVGTQLHFQGWPPKIATKGPEGWHQQVGASEVEVPVESLVDLAVQDTASEAAPTLLLPGGTSGVPLDSDTDLSQFAAGTVVADKDGDLWQATGSGWKLKDGTSQSEWSFESINSLGPFTVMGDASGAFQSAMSKQPEVGSSLAVGDSLDGGALDKLPVGSVVSHGSDMYTKGEDGKWTSDYHSFADGSVLSSYLYPAKPSLTSLPEREVVAPDAPVGTTIDTVSPSDAQAALDALPPSTVISGGGSPLSWVKNDQGQWEAWSNSKQEMGVLDSEYIANGADGSPIVVGASIPEVGGGVLLTPQLAQLAPTGTVMQTKPYGWDSAGGGVWTKLPSGEWSLPNGQQTLPESDMADGKLHKVVSWGVAKDTSAVEPGKTVGVDGKYYKVLVAPQGDQDGVAVVVSDKGDHAPGTVVTMAPDAFLGAVEAFPVESGPIQSSELPDAQTEGFEGFKYAKYGDTVNVQIGDLPVGSLFKDKSGETWMVKGHDVNSIITDGHKNLSVDPTALVRSLNDSISTNGSLSVGNKVDSKDELEALPVGGKVQFSSPLVPGEPVVWMKVGESGTFALADEAGTGESGTPLSLAEMAEGIGSLSFLHEKAPFVDNSGPLEKKLPTTTADGLPAQDELTPFKYAKWGNTTFDPIGKLSVGTLFEDKAKSKYTVVAHVGDTTVYEDVVTGKQYATTAGSRVRVKKQSLSEASEVPVIFAGNGRALRG